MPVDKRKAELRSMLAGKTIEELEELLALDFTEQEDAEPNMDYITTILEVIEEREGNREKIQAETEAAWIEFQEYYKLRKQEEALDAGKTKGSNLEHHCKTEYGQRPRKYTRVLRHCVIAAAVVVLLCGTAFGWNIFQTIADWTSETFYFLTGHSQGESAEHDVYENLRRAIAPKIDIYAVPTWAPEGTVENGELNVIERKDRSVIQTVFLAGEREFTVRIIIHDDIPEDYTDVYQKGTEVEQEYQVGGITHYIMGNYDNLSAMWTNGNVEGHIQGNLTLDEMQRMIDSIYEE